MNENPKCFDATGLSKTIPELLQRISNDTNSASDPCQVLLSIPKDGLAELVEFITSIDDDYERTVTATADGVCIAGQSKAEHGSRLVSGDGRVVTSPLTRYKLKDLYICHLEVAGELIEEPFATKRHTQSLINVVRQSQKLERPIRYILHSGASLKYLPLFEEQSGLDTKVYNLLAVPMYDGDPWEGIIPHRDLTAGTEWLKETCTYSELTEEQPEELIEHLIPEKALTIISAPSYTGKTH